MQIRVRANLKPLQKQAELTRKQLKFATANTLTSVAQRRVLPYERIKIKQDLDRPTPFTVNAFHSFRATPGRLTAGVFIKTRQFDWLYWQIYGGVRRFRNRKPVPIEQRLNKFGNITRRGLAGARAKPNVFEGGATKEYTLERVGERVRALAVWVNRIAYRVRFRFFDHGRTMVDRWLVRDWNAAVRKEIRRVEARAGVGR